MKGKLLYTVFSVVLLLGMLLSACAPAATPAPAPTSAPAQPTAAPVEPTAAPVEPTQAPVEPVAAPAQAEAKPCLVIGATYVGSVNDAGYNQALHDSLVEVTNNISCVKLLEAENVYEGPDAERVIEKMIGEGAKFIVPTSFGHQEPAMNVAKKHPDVIFEHAGGYMMDANFANFYGTPPDAFYLMGKAAGLATKSNKLGFVAAMPLGWTITFINSFELGAQSVNPKAETIVTFTGSWSDRAKEAAATDALINQGVDVVTMHVDAPGTVIQTAEARNVWSIGFQSLAAQQFAPKYWLSGTGFTFGKLLTKMSQEIIDGKWKPEFIRCTIAQGCMGVAPFGSSVSEEIKTQVNTALDEINAGKVTIFKGPLTDQAGTVQVKEGETINEEQMGNMDWFVKGVIGQPK